MLKEFVQEKMNVINLKKDEYFLKQYVSLRNSYTKLLLTSPVVIGQTKKWLTRDDIEIRGLAQANVLLGIAILYIGRNGEIAFFVKYPSKGIGSRLLKIIEVVAKERGLKYTWAWVLKDNLMAQRAFIKNGFKNEGTSSKEYQGAVIAGIRYIKILNDQP